MEKPELMNMPRRQLKARQHLQDEDEEVETSVKIFSLENVADRVYHRKKKVIGEFDDEAVDEEGHTQNDNRNQLAVLPSDLDDEEATGEEMEDWLKKLHIRTQHLVGKVTVNGMSRLAATNNVATALTRFKAKARTTVDNDESEEGNSSIGTDQSLPQTGTTPIRTVIEQEIPTKEVSVRSKKIVKQSLAENRVLKRKEISSAPKMVVVSSHIRKPIRSHPPIPDVLAVSIDGTQKTNRVKIMKSTRDIVTKPKIH